MKDKAIVANIGHFDNEIDMAGLYAARSRHVERVNIKAQYDEFVFKKRARASSCSPRAGS
jgi:adenosylhomocysteinase